MQNVKSYLCSSVGKKQIIAITGLIWSGFLLTHMAGNLLILVGADAYNKYGHAIITNPGLYPAEAFLAIAFLIHMGLAMKLTLENRKARPVKPAQSPTNCAKGASFASKTMILSGLLVFVFLVTHLKTFKYGPHYSTTVNGVEMRDLHKLIVEEFHEPEEVGWYVFSLIVLGLHLSHGISSLFQTFGLGSVRSCKIKKIGWLFTGLVILGFLSQPLFIFFQRGQ